MMLGWEFPPHHSGGLGVACMGLSKAMAEAGADIKFVLPKRVPVNSDWMDFVFPDSDISVRRFEVSSALMSYANIYSYKKQLEEEGIDPDYAGTLVEEVMRYGREAGSIAAQEDFDVIHAHDWLTFPAAIEAKRVSGKPLIVHIHATEFNRTASGNVNQAIYDIERAGVHAADKVIAVSRFMKDLVRDKYGVSEEKIEVVHNGIDPSIYNYRELPPFLETLKEEGKYLVSFLGRITVQKGPEYFLEAAKRVLEVRDDVYFAIAGSGDMAEELKHKSKEWGISDHVIFTGWITGDTNLRLFQSSDLFVMPSVSEPFGLVGLEALLNKTPLLVSKQSGVSEVLKHAMKVDFWDTQEMANKIISILDHPSLMEELTTQGNKEALSVTWTKSALGVLGLYDHLLQTA